MIHCEYCDVARPFHADDCTRVVYAAALRLPVEDDE